MQNDRYSFEKKAFLNSFNAKILSSFFIIVGVKYNASLQILVLTFHCINFQDNLISRYQEKSSDTKFRVQLKQATKICNDVSATLEAVASASDEPFDMNADALESVAKGRHVLTRVADYLYKFFIKGDSSICGDHDVKWAFASLLEAVKRLCQENPDPSTPHMFLVRQLVRCYGFDCVRTLGRCQELQWIVPPDARQQVRFDEHSSKLLRFSCCVVVRHWFPSQHPHNIL